MDNTNSVELRINVAAMLTRLNAEKDNLIFMMATEPDDYKRALYNGALIHITAAAQFVYRAKEL